MFFEITHKDKHSKARTGIMHTDHGDVETPIFMPVGTQATVKSVDSKDLESINTQIILANTYHLHLRPGEDLIDSFGGLHKFMKWDKPMLTDSGGYQVFSLGKRKETNDFDKHEQGSLVSIDDTGVDFTSHIDGSKKRLTPTEAIKVQHKLGADIIMAFDECTPDSATFEYATEAMERTHRWAKECITAHKEDTEHHGYKQFLFGIVQGAQHEELRKKSAEFISSLDFDGIAIGGESVGYNMEATKKILEWIMPLVPEEKPHYTMGVGLSPKDLFEVVEHGIDMFDCVSPTRVARNGSLFVHPSVNPKGKIKITNAEFAEDKTPIDETLTNSPTKQYSRAYIHHLFKTQELLAFRIATIHNLYFLSKLMENIRTSIKEDRFLEFKKEWCE